MRGISTIEAYENIANSQSKENFIQDLKSRDDYQTIRFKSNDPINTDSLIKNVEFLAAILNDDYVIQIGKYLVKLNPLKGKVYTLHFKNYNEYDDLLIENINNSAISEYSMEEEVIEMLKLRDEIGETSNNTAMINTAVKFRFHRHPPCSESNGKYRSNPKAYLTGTNIRYSWWCQYTWYGIYFPLRAVVESEILNTWGWGPNTTALKINGGRKFKPKCHYERLWNTEVKSENTSSLTWEPYGGTTRLHKYRITGDFYYSSSNIYLGTATVEDGY